MFISPMSSVKTNSYCQTQLKRIHENPQPQPQQPTFKGEKGALLGLGTGLAGTLLAVGLTAITGGAALPVLLGEAAVLAGGAAGGYAGHKIEDGIKNAKKNNQNK